ncbi:RNA-directed DNA polymerase [Zhihengliuella halotolerans]|uniref:Reverse transcriptase (RNA-dependent DNA polymerase) n=1 Tax=Zhihengliuella halotolerans TaxID=370736 RepID=A0A4Q8AB32_9MICC|nr:RNA-directed DNA polymerase [Zhihengliuella halotolerans]RZU61224.1 reverse transcriptase (RNA-dependent DNA polymerase) [Zhihengliuella halotolerans]
MELKNSKTSPLRALLTECLPYELPLEVSSKWLYDWIDARSSRVDSKGIHFRPRDTSDLLVLALLSSKNSTDLTTLLPTHASKNSSPRVVVDSPLLFKVPDWRAPASFIVRRDRLRTRELDILALSSQVSIAYLYYTRKDALLYYANADSSSLRHPLKVNSYGKNLNSQFIVPRTDPIISVETAGRTLGTYNSYFVYADHAFVGQFYDSSKWQALEAHWRFMRRLDVTNCFRSIYTHSFAWSTGTDSLSKLHLRKSRSYNDYLDLGRTFDKVMQSCNWGETHGICIGPEASRVFAEIIFQSLDQKIKSRLREYGLKQSSFEILRYVDDYFLFASDMSDIDTVSHAVSEVLTEHRFAINETKTRDYVTPFTTEISARKARLKLFLKSSLPFEGSLPDYDSRDIGIELKSLLIGSENDAATIGTSLSHIERRLRKFIGKRTVRIESYDEALELQNYSWDFAHSMLNQYLSHPSVSSAMKIVRILRIFSFFSSYCSRLTEREQNLLKIRANENLRFSIQKSIHRLSESANSEIELCHFLSLATASSVKYSSSSRSAASLITKLESTSISRNNAKSNQAPLLLHLSAMKFFLQLDGSDEETRTRIINRSIQIAESILSDSYIPYNVIKSHASQELYILAIATCPFLDVEERLRILNQPWLRQLISDWFLPGAKPAAVTRFLRRLLIDAVTEGTAIQPYSWTGDDFDSSLYEKEAQFIY